MQPRPPRQFRADPCPKCTSTDARTIFHAGGKGEFGPQMRTRCAWNDWSDKNGEHLHAYCQVCHFDWTQPLPTT